MSKAEFGALCDLGREQAVNADGSNTRDDIATANHRLADLHRIVCAPGRAEEKNVAKDQRKSICRSLILQSSTECPGRLKRRKIILLGIIEYSHRHHATVIIRNLRQ